MIKVAIFDDHQHRREALKLMMSLNQEITCIGDYENCSNLVANLGGNPPDVVLMDIHMPGVNGIEGVKLLREHFPQTYIIMQTVFDDDDNLFNSIMAGAHGYLLKNTAPDKILEAIIEVYNGGAPMTPSIARRVLNYFNRKPVGGKEEYNLSAREVEILEWLVKGYSQKMVAAELHLSRHTINNHIKNIYQKLHVHSVSEAVATAIQKRIVE
ncbi:MAG TPA: response regulator transcription factor [Puia sp.]